MLAYHKDCSRQKINLFLLKNIETSFLLKFRYWGAAGVNLFTMVTYVTSK